jgi:hypothetical protein
MDEPNFLHGIKPASVDYQLSCLRATAWPCSKAVREPEKADHGWRAGIMNRIAQLILLGAEDDFGGN